MTFCRRGAPGCRDGKTERGGCATSESIPWTDNPVSRQAAKYAKVAKNDKDLHFAVLCALASWRELFFQTLSRLGPSCPDVSGLVFSQGPSSHTARGLQNNKEYYVRSQYVIENKGTHCRNESKRTHFERQMRRLNPRIELSLHTPVRARGPCRKHTARFDKEPARGTPQNPMKCENSGNKAKKLLKTKEVNFNTNLRQSNFVPQTSVLIRCLNQSRIEATRGAGPCHKWFVEEPNRSALQSTTKYKNRGNELKDLLQRQGITEIAASKRTHFCAEKAANDAERSGISRIVTARRHVTRAVLPPRLLHSFLGTGGYPPLGPFSTNILAMAGSSLAWASCLRDRVSHFWKESR